MTPLRALATDFDGTLAHHGTVSDETLNALKRLKEAGFKLILVTGRELYELMGIFPEMDLFDLAVVENGAVIYNPDNGNLETLAPAPSSDFVARLHESHLSLQVGKVIVATWEQHKAEVEEVIQVFREKGENLQMICNKDAVMILPSGVNKASGLRAALPLLGLTAEEVVGVGDAENDEAFLEICGYSVAVANALPQLFEKVDLVTKAGHGEGVTELIEELLKPQK